MRGARRLSDGSSEPEAGQGIGHLGGCRRGALGLSGASPKLKEPPPPKVEESIGSLAFIQSHGVTKLEGVGLVIGLDNTGADAPPSFYRKKLIDDMRKAGVENAEKWLSNPTASLVIVRMDVLPGASTKDRLDATIELPPASGTKSLAGGVLLECRLREVMVLGGMPRDGADFAFVKGPVMTGSSTNPGSLKVGRVLGGGRIRKEIPHRLVLNDNRKSFKTAAIVEKVVNQRFPESKAVNEKGEAHAKDFQHIELKVPSVYHQNQDRFFRVVKLLMVVDSPEFRAKRMAAWEHDLLDPKKAGIAALKLEGLGGDAAEALKHGLASSNSQIQFFSAEALAYLNDASGADVLAEVVRTKPEFRAEALAALAASDQPAFHMALRGLMEFPDVNVRYGAFNALRTLAPDDAFLGQVRVLDLPKVDPDEESGEDSMAIALTRAAARRNHKEDPFSLYIVDCEGPPMVHVARSRRCEVVLFGRGLKLLPPVCLGNGPYLLNASDGDQSVQISKIIPNKYGNGDAKVQANLELGDVLRRAANLGATYPELVTILQAAERQKNLPGPLVVDAVPGSSPEYIKAELLGVDLSKSKSKSKKDDAVERTSGKDDTPPKRRGLFNRIFGRDE